LIDSKGKKQLSSLLEKLDNLFFLLITVQVVGGITVYFIRANNFIEKIHLHPVYFLVLIIINTLTVVLAKVFTKNFPGTEKFKLKEFEKLNVRIWVVLFSANILNGAAFLFTGNYFTLLIFFLILLLFFTNRPALLFPNRKVE